MADAREDIAIAMRVGVMSALGFRRSEIAATLGLEPAEVRAATERVRRATQRMG